MLSRASFSFINDISFKSDLYNTQNNNKNNLLLILRKMFNYD